MNLRALLRRMPNVTRVPFLPSVRFIASLAFIPITPCPFTDSIKSPGSSLRSSGALDAPGSSAETIMFLLSCRVNSMPTPNVVSLDSYSLKVRVVVVEVNLSPAEAALLGFRRFTGELAYARVSISVPLVSTAKASWFPKHIFEMRLMMLISSTENHDPWPNLLCFPMHRASDIPDDCVSR
eukprot:967493-Rhodomonas_salina.3